MEALCAALSDAAEILENHGYYGVAARLRGNARQLATGDRSALITVLAEATGGAGSFRDVYLYPADDDQRVPLNAKLEALVEAIARMARDALREA